MNMNQMMGNMNMGNMNPMGMNNQLMTNFGMDETAMRMRAIIAPYEQKITELEKIIKQKDFEILVLKEKLNKYEKNQICMNMPMNMMNNAMNMNMMNNAMNWMDPYNNMANNNMMNMNLNNINMMNNVEEPKINIIFLYKNNEYKELCSQNERIKNALKRFCKRISIRFKKHLFTFGGKRINSKLTVNENGILDNSKILVVENISNPNPEYEETDSDEDRYSIIFKATSGNTKSIRVNQDCPIGTAVKKFLVKSGVPEMISRPNDIHFLFNGQAIKLKIKQKQKIFLKEIQMEISL